MEDNQKYNTARELLESIAEMFPAIKADSNSYSVVHLDVMANLRGTEKLKKSLEGMVTIVPLRDEKTEDDHNIEKDEEQSYEFEAPVQISSGLIIEKELADKEHLSYKVYEFSPL